MYQHAKNLDIVDYKIWLAEKHFDPHLRTKIFSKYGICAGTQQIINIHRTNSIKSKDQMFSQFLSFMNQKTFFQKVQLCHTQPHMVFYQHVKTWKKTWQKKKGGRADIPYFTRPFLLPPRVQCCITQFRHHWIFRHHRILQEQYWSIMWTGKTPTWNLKWVNGSSYQCKQNIKISLEHFLVKLFLDQIIRTENLNNSTQDALPNDITIQNNLSAPDYSFRGDGNTNINQNQVTNLRSIIIINFIFIDNMIDFRVTNSTNNNWVNVTDSNDVIITSAGNITKIVKSEKLKIN